jgi:hypothetical protein
MNHYTYGRTLDTTEVIDGVIMLNTDQDRIEVGPLSDLTDMHGETATDPNGIEIDVERLVENMTLKLTDSENIRSASPEKAAPSSLFSPRMNTFHGLFQNYLKGEIKHDMPDA